MQQRADDGSLLPRREFLRRSTIGAVALAALGSGVAHGGSRSVLAELTADPSGAMPSQPIAAVAVMGRSVVSVGGVRGAPSVWRRSGLDEPWFQVAGADAFPQGTALTALAIEGHRAVAVGCSGPDHATRPAIFSSRDLRSWTIDTDRDLPPGVLTGVAFSGRRGLAVGARFAEPDVEEPIETIAYQRGGSGRWVPVAMPGVRPVRHGAVTLLAGIGDRLMLGLTDVEGLDLSTAPGVEGPWRSIGAPHVVAPVAAAAVGGSTLLAGIDALDRARFWRRAGRSWIEVDPPSGIGASIKVHDLGRAGDALIVAGSRGDQGFLREVKVS
jgi:hypothetical protein